MVTSADYLIDTRESRMLKQPECHGFKNYLVEFMFTRVNYFLQDKKVKKFGAVYAVRDRRIKSNLFALKELKGQDKLDLRRRGEPCF